MPYYRPILLFAYIYTKTASLKSVGYVKQHYKISDLGNRKQPTDHSNIQYCITYFDIGSVVNVARSAALLTRTIA